MKTEKTIWRVRAYSSVPLTGYDQDLQANEDVTRFKQFEHYFTTRDKAHQFYEVGEKTMGTRHGLTWFLDRIPVDSHFAQIDIDELANTLTEGDEE